MAGRIAGQRDRRIKTFAEVTDPTNKVAPRDRERDSTLTQRKLGGKTKARGWVANESDELAIENGCLFDEYRADHFRQVCEDHFRFWEGSHSGRPFILEDYQWEDLAPLWGWVLFDEHHGRLVVRMLNGLGRKRRGQAHDALAKAEPD
ncbi:MAG: hypothetical protein IH852_09175 [Bacteroidetes bacterium]|nr:hypothetical protein [Bacteroidota bacterium]